MSGTSSHAPPRIVTRARIRPADRPARPAPAIAEAGRILFGLFFLAMATVNTFATLRHPEVFTDIADLAVLPGYAWLFRDVIQPNATPLTILLIAFEATVGLLAFGKGSAVRLALLAAILFQLAVSPAVGLYGLANLPLIAIWALLPRIPFDRTVPAMISSRAARLRVRQGGPR